MTFIAGRQGRTEFIGSVRGFETELRDMSNDVATGLYTNVTSTGNNISCVGNSTTVGVTLTQGTEDTRGASNGCILIGNAIQLAPSGTSYKGYTATPIVGRQFKNNDISQGTVETYSDSRVRVVARTSSTSTIPDAADKRTLASGATIVCAFYSTAENSRPAESNPCAVGANLVPTDIFSYMSTFQTSQDGGSNTVNLVVPATQRTLNSTSYSAANDINSYANAATAPVINPSGGVHICINSASSRQYALIRVGGQNAATAVSSIILEGRCS